MSVPSSAFGVGSGEFGYDAYVVVQVEVLSVITSVFVAAVSAGGRVMPAYVGSGRTGVIAAVVLAAGRGWSASLDSALALKLSNEFSPVAGAG